MAQELTRTDHREALALAIYESQMEQFNNGARRTDGKEPDASAIRLQVEDMRYRCDALRNPRVMVRYIQNRGFDPREVRASSPCRWLQ